MTRLEETRKASIKYSPNIAARRLGFIEGAMWADKTMIDKVCDWLGDNMKNYAAFDSDIIKDLKKQWRDDYEQRTIRHEI